MISLSDKYTQQDGVVFLTAPQALVRVLIEQRRRDTAAGHHTAGFVSGYRGSPLGGLDTELWRARDALGDHIRFQPGLNEDLAVTSVWGSQQTQVFPGARYDGVFGLWYAKGPGVDRAGDALKHANSFGTSPLGGVLAVAGDDHGAKSSSLAHQSEFALLDAMIPVLHPADLTDILALGLYAYAMSRFSGLWIGMKLTAALAESSGTAVVPAMSLAWHAPVDFPMPQGGLHVRWPDDPLSQERRLVLHRLAAARAFARTHPMDRSFGAVPPRPARIAIMSAGKSWRDVRAALGLLGLAEEALPALGIRLLKIALVWPLDAQRAREMCAGLDEVLVVEEKRSLLESQLREALYDLPQHSRPRICGKIGAASEPLLSAVGELSVDAIARAIAARLRACLPSLELGGRLASVQADIDAVVPFVSGRRSTDEASTRQPYFCAGCPHNSSTRVPEHSFAFGGIGCHSMAMFMESNTVAYTHMGGEGATWIGHAPFTTLPHAFQNLGDGTFSHSGSLGVRAAIAAGVNITFKILHNDAVAMTGGQPVEGTMTVPAMTRLLHAEGVRRIDIVAEDVDRYRDRTALAPGTGVHERAKLDAVQRQLRDTRGTSVLIYDQVCAAEKRRRRKRGRMAPAAKRVFINEAVCEGCGDCGIQSNCLAIAPANSLFGTKRRIDQHACNADYSCLQGFCPSFVTVHGVPRAEVAKVAATAMGMVPALGTAPAVASAAALTLHDPEPSREWSTFSLLAAGTGGTGVVTAGAICAMAAHIEGLACATYDMTGMAQKGGAVLTHVTFAKQQDDLTTAQIPPSGANLLLGFDMLAASSIDALVRLKPGGTAVVNSHESMTGVFARRPDLSFPGDEARKRLRSRAARCEWLDAHALAEQEFGEPLVANLLLLGFAFQQGEIPLAAKSLETAIRLNGGEAQRNLAAFAFGRRLAQMPLSVDGMPEGDSNGAPNDPRAADSTALDALVAQFETFLTRYQNVAYARRYRDFVMRASAAESRIVPGSDRLAMAVARGLARLMAYKDEYEVARLYTQSSFLEDVRARFDGRVRLTFNFAPPLLASVGAGERQRPRKREFGAWMIPMLRVLAAARGLRGTSFDVFGYSADRRFERHLLRSYEETIDGLLADLDLDNHALAVEIAELWQGVRGYGHVKRDHWERVRAQERELRQRFRARSPRGFVQAPPEAVS